MNLVQTIKGKLMENTMTGTKEDAQQIISSVIHAVMPDTAVKKALQQIDLGKGNLYVISIGKAGWTMAKAVQEVLGNRITKGICITKYGHVKGKIDGIDCYEAGHPVTDEKGISATRKAVEMVQALQEEDTVLFLISGGGSALFEEPRISLEEYQRINEELLKCGADIKEINTVRKHLSKVKGGWFAKICEPAQVKCIILSDVLGNSLDSIASGPACADATTIEDAVKSVHQYQISIDTDLFQETPKQITNVETQIIGSVEILCTEAEKICKQLGYQTEIWCTDLSCEAKDAGEYFAKKAQEHSHDTQSYALIAGGETVVHVKGNGKGGRNQEMALACADGIAGMKDVCFFSVGSDGTDGPTDAAGGIVTGKTKEKLAAKGISLVDKLQEHDSYHALKMCDGLVMTGPTGTNVNDFSVLLIKK